MTQSQGKKLLQACEAFLAGWLHFCDHINFAKSNLDADSIRFMNEVPGKIQTATKEALTTKDTK